MSRNELIKHLEDNGCIECVGLSPFSDVFVYERDGITLPICREDNYWFFEVVEICDGFKIPSPAHHKTSYDQLVAQLKKRGGGGHFKTITSEN